MKLPVSASLPIVRVAYALGAALLAGILLTASIAVSAGTAHPLTAAAPSEPQAVQSAAREAETHTQISHTPLALSDARAAGPASPAPAQAAAAPGRGQRSGRLSLHNHPGWSYAIRAHPLRTPAAVRKSSICASKETRTCPQTSSPCSVAGRGQRGQPADAAGDPHRGRSAYTRRAGSENVGAVEDFIRQLRARFGPDELPRRDQECGAPRHRSPRPAGSARSDSPVTPSRWTARPRGLHRATAWSRCCSSRQAAAGRDAGDRAGVPGTDRQGEVWLDERGCPCALRCTWSYPPERTDRTQKPICRAISPAFPSRLPAAQLHRRPHRWQAPRPVRNRQSSFVVEGPGSDRPLGRRMDLHSRAGGPHPGLPALRKMYVP